MGDHIGTGDRAHYGGHIADRSSARPLALPARAVTLLPVTESESVTHDRPGWSRASLYRLAACGVSGVDGIAAESILSVQLLGLWLVLRRRDGRR